MAKRLFATDLEKCVGCGLCTLACSRRNGYIGNDRAGIISVSLSGFERGATVIFCRACDDPSCAQVCPTGALTRRKGGGVIYKEEFCIGCKNCVKTCTIGAIFERNDGKISVCIHCGYCVNFCPHNVLALKEVSE